MLEARLTVQFLEDERLEQLAKRAPVGTHGMNRIGYVEQDSVARTGADRRAELGKQRDAGH
jgi:hypothetical protein